MQSDEGSMDKGYEDVHKHSFQVIENGVGTNNLVSARKNEEGGGFDDRDI